MKIKEFLNNIDNEYSQEPKLTSYVSFGKRYITFPIIVEENTFNNVFTYKPISILKTNYNYGGLVDTFIKMIYSDREMTAIINNYLLDSSNENTIKEFNEMQEVRKEAKELAKEILEKYPLSSL